jgi:uncharacterized protein YceK
MAFKTFIAMAMLLFILMLSIAGCVGIGVRINNAGYPYSGVRCFPTFVKVVYGYMSYSSSHIKKTRKVDAHAGTTKIELPWYYYIVIPISYTVMTTVVIIDLPTELVFDTILLPMDLSRKKTNKLYCN